MLTVIGTPVSPYARKVMAVLALKGLSYRLDPVIPFLGDERFSAISPLRRIPVLIDGTLVLPDSTAIGEYLDDAHPEPPLRPADAATRARMRWLEEFADSRLGHVVVGRLFFGGLVGPRVLGLPRDDEAFADALTTDLPAALGQLEALLGPGEGFAFGERPTLGDLAAGTMLQMLAMMRQPLDADRFRRAASLLMATDALPEMQVLMTQATAFMTAPRGEGRSALTAAGATLVPETDSVAGTATLPRVAA